MGSQSGADESLPLGRIRSWLLLILLFGILGAGCELLLLGHFESAPQWIPLVLLAAGAIVLCWHAALPSVASVRALQGTMTLFLFAGVIGVGLHYDGNVEFEREMYPTMGGFELVRRSVTGATPVLAPGTMALLGLIGLAHTYRHPKGKVTS